MDLRGTEVHAIVRVSSSGAISVRFKSAFKWEGKVAWNQCGTWPGTSMAEIREERDKARQLVKRGINPNDHKKAARVESRAQVEATLAEARRRETEDLSFRAMFEAWLADGVSRRRQRRAQANVRERCRALHWRQAGPPRG